jgi:protein TonB
MQRDVWRIGLNYAEQQRDPAKHAIGIGVVIVMHVILGWALLNGLARTVIDVIKGPIDTKIIEENKPPPPPDNLPPPKVVPPPPSFVPPPEVLVNAPQTAAPTITVTTTPPPPVVVPPPVVAAPPAPPPRVAARPAIADATQCKPEYPAIATKEDISNVVTKIRFTVDASGKLAGAEVVASAGPTRAHKALDRAAVSALSECRFSAGIDENGRPTGSSFVVEYLWKLQ